jgi:hypothetical protein
MNEIIKEYKTKETKINRMSFLRKCVSVTKHEEKNSTFCNELIKMAIIIQEDERAVGKWWNHPSE